MVAGVPGAIPAKVASGAARHTAKTGIMEYIEPSVHLRSRRQRRVYQIRPNQRS